MDSKWSKKWYCKFPLDAYALGPIEFENYINEKMFRKYVRKWLGIKKLSKYFQCWTTS